MLFELGIGKFLLPGEQGRWFGLDRLKVKAHPSPGVRLEQAGPLEPGRSRLADQPLDPNDPWPPLRQVSRATDEVPDLADWQGDLQLATDPGQRTCSGLGEAPEIPYEKGVLELAHDRRHALEALDALLPPLRVTGDELRC